MVLTCAVSPGTPVTTSSPPENTSASAADASSSSERMRTVDDDSLNLAMLLVCEFTDTTLNDLRSLLMLTPSNTIPGNIKSARSKFVELAISQPHTRI